MKIQKSGILATLLILFCVTLLFPSLPVAAAEKKEIRTTASSTDVQRLEGRWVRPDGGYVLELKNIEKDGSLTAAYYNPRPIKVFRAEAAKKDGVLSVFVELRDVNYPGSTYKLQYDAATDQLKGTYFQAVERQTFNVRFLRAK